MRTAIVLALLLTAGCVETRDAEGTTPGTNGGANGGGPGAPDAPDPVTLAVTASAPYAFAPKTLTAPAGALVNLTLTNSDPLLPHDWVLDEAGASTDVIGSGETATVTFEAPEAGTYEFYCSVGNHRQLGMVGTFTVT